VEASVIITLTNTTAGKVHGALMEARRRAGNPAMGMVLTLVVVTDEDGFESALIAAGEAAREHPCRILVLIASPHDESPRLDADVSIGADEGPAETIVLRLTGPLAGHADSVVVPLLVSDAPVVVWWPGEAPMNPRADAVGAMAQRRITDTAGQAVGYQPNQPAGAPTEPRSVLAARADAYAPGDTDLAWTRLTPWRSLLAAALDSPYAPIVSATVEAEPGNPSAALLAAWLSSRLRVPVHEGESTGPGITGASLQTEDGEIAISRPDGVLAKLSVPGRPERSVALKRRELAELVAEELRRLDPDEIYAATLEELAAGLLGPPSRAENPPAPAGAGAGS
jgi:glucose-6-phosphate dehydrogenase assembly protein OpcA